jgi:hypothetical protein
MINPSLEELSLRGRPFLRKIHDVGPYEDLDHYLDVNFRLLKEDFQEALRLGLKQYKMHNYQNEQNFKKTRNMFINIY